MGKSFLMMFTSFLLFCLPLATTSAQSSKSASGWTTAGASGGGTMQFSGPSGVAVDSKGRIYVADQGNSRIVRMDDMTGANWRSITGGDIITSAPMEPITTDFDNQGMLYIANYFTDSALGDVVRIASVYDPTSYEVVEPGTPNTCATALAIDRTIDRVYYAQGSSVLSWKPTVNIAAKPLTYDTGMGPIQSLAADGGVVYFIVAYPSPVALCSWNPAQAGTPKSTSIGLMNPSDIMIKGGYVYVADLGPAVAPAPKILRFTTNLDYVDSFSGPEHDPLIMPMRFIKTLDNQIVVQDENFDGIFDRFLSFTSMTGTDWRSWYPDGDPIRGFNPVN